MRDFWRSIALVPALLSAWCGLALAQMKTDVTKYPDKPVHVVVGYTAGGGTDAVGRLVATRLSESLGGTFIVENRPGAGGNIAATLVASAKDPYRLLFAGNAHVINKSLYADPRYDPINDFAPIALIAVAPNVFAANPQLGVKSLQDLIALAKAKPNTITYATGGTGTPQHLAMALFEAMAGIKLVHVPYNGGGPAVASTLGAQTDLLSMSVPTTIPHIKSGKLVALGVSTRARSPLLPDTPTVEEGAGLRGYEAVGWYGLLGPAGMPQGAVDKLNAALNKELKDSAVQSKLSGDGFLPSATTPAEFRKFLESDMAKWSKVVKDLGLKVD